MEARTQQSGHLEDVCALDLLQSLGIYRRSGHVRFFHAHGTSTLWFSAGQIVDAQSGALRGAAAVYRIVTHDRGEFRVEITAEPRPRTIELPTTALIFEAARRLDEGQRVRQRLPAPDVVLTCRGPMPSLADATEAEHRPTRSRFDGGATLGEVLERSPLGELETLLQVDALVEAGELEPTGAVREPPPPALDALHAVLPRALERPQPIASLADPARVAVAIEPVPAPTRRWWIPATLGGVVSMLVTLGAMHGGDDRSASSMDRQGSAAEPTPLAVTGRPIAGFGTEPAAASVARRMPEPSVTSDREVEPTSAADDRTASSRSPSAASKSRSRSKHEPRASRARSTPTLDPKDTRTPPPATRTSTAEDPSALIVDARRAYTSGDATTAHRLAGRSHALRPSADAAELMALAACSLDEPDEAAQALRDVPLLRRASVRAKCKQAHGVRLKPGRGAR